MASRARAGRPARRNARLACTRVAMEQSRVMPTHNPQRFTCATAQVISASQHFNPSACTMPATRSRMPCRDEPDRLIAAPLASLRRARCVIQGERSSQHVDGSSLYADRSRSTSCRSSRSLRAIIFTGCSTISTRDRLRSARRSMRHARRRVAECGEHIASTRGTIERHGVHDRLITARDARQVSVGSSRRVAASSHRVAASSQRSFALSNHSAASSNHLAASRRRVAALGPRVRRVVDSLCAVALDSSSPFTYAGDDDARLAHSGY